MSDFKTRIDDCQDWRDLQAVLDELAVEVEQALNAPYEGERQIRRAHDLELLLRYGEQRLEKLLS
jgi:hypothetical protein